MIQKLAHVVRVAVEGISSLSLQDGTGQAESAFRTQKPSFSPLAAFVFAAASVKVDKADAILKVGTGSPGIRLETPFIGMDRIRLDTGTTGETEWIDSSRRLGQSFALHPFATGMCESRHSTAGHA